MESTDATPVVRTIRLNRHALVALLGLGAIGAGFLVPASAVPADADGAHKSYVCKYVGKPGEGEGERPQTGQNPIWVANAAIMASTGKESVEVGDTFADAQGRSIVIVANTQKLDPEPGVDQCPGTTPPRTTTTPPRTTTTPPSTTTTTPVVGGTTSVGGGGGTETGAAAVVETGAAAVAEPAAVPVRANAVPPAATDGVDLVAQSGSAEGLRGLLFGSGVLMLGGGLLGLRRKAQV